MLTPNLRGLRFESQWLPTEKWRKKQAGNQKNWRKNNEQRTLKKEQRTKNKEQWRNKKERRRKPAEKPKQEVQGKAQRWRQITFFSSSNHYRGRHQYFLKAGFLLVSCWFPPAVERRWESVNTGVNHLVQKPHGNEMVSILVYTCMPKMPNEHGNNMWEAGYFRYTYALEHFLNEF